MPFAKAADGTQIFYRRFNPRGQNPPDHPTILAIAPLGISARVWEIAIPNITSRGYSVIAMDNRGSGRSTARLSFWSVSTMADDAIAVLDREEIHRAHVGGPSLGGMIAQELVLRHPDRVGALVLASTTAGLPRLDLMPLRVLPRLLLLPVRAAVSRGSEQDAVRRFLETAVSPRTAEETHPGEPLWRLVEEILREPNPIPGRCGQVMAGALHSTWSRLGAIRAPTLVQHGTDDRLIPARAGKALADQIPSAQFEPIQRAGHALLLERPEQVTDSAMRFIAQHDDLLS